MITPPTNMVKPKINSMNDFIHPAISVVIPAYNEENGINAVIYDIEQALSSLENDFEIIVVDDGSSDNTTVEVEATNARLIRHTYNKGYGAALKTGVRHANYSKLLIIDADGTYPVAAIENLLQHNSQADMVVAARVGDNVHIPLIRVPAKWVLNRLANYLTRRDIPDLNSGLRLFEKASLVKLIHLLPDGFSFTTTITIAMITNNFIVDYMPIDYMKRVGKSKIRPIYDTLNFFLLIIRMILYFKPLQVLLPVSLALFSLDAAKVVYDIISYDGHIATSTILLGIVAFNTLLIALISDLITTLRRSMLIDS